MKTTDQATNDGKEPIPPGFTLVPSGQDAFVIRHKRTGGGGYGIFWAILFICWTFLSAVLLRDFLRGEVGIGGLLLSCGFEVVIAYMLVYLFFCRKTFRINSDRLIMETELLGFKRTKTITRESIKRFVQVKADTGGEDGETFPSLALEVEADTKATILYRQEYEAIHWLGQTLAQWADVEFIESTEEPRMPR
jgi:hypothetical protein